MELTHRKKIHLAHVDSPRLWLDQRPDAVAEAESLANESVRLALALFGEVTVLAHELLDFPPFLREDGLRPLLLQDPPLISVHGFAQKDFAETLLYALRRGRDRPQFFKSHDRDSPHLRIRRDERERMSLEDFSTVCPTFSNLIEQVASLDQAYRSNGLRIITGIGTGSSIRGMINYVEKLQGQPPEALRGIQRPVDGWWDSRGGAYVAAYKLIGDAAALGQEAENVATGKAQHLVDLYDVATRIRYAALTHAVVFHDYGDRSLGDEPFDEPPDPGTDIPLFQVSVDRRDAGFRLRWDKYERLSTFRERLVNVPLDEFVALIGDGQLRHLRGQLWSAFFDEDVSRCQKGIDRVFRYLNDGLAATTVPIVTNARIAGGPISADIAVPTIVALQSSVASVARGAARRVYSPLHGIVSPYFGPEKDQVGRIAAFRARLKAFASQALGEGDRPGSRPSLPRAD